jgi:hypothetical protein
LREAGLMLQRSKNIRRLPSFDLHLDLVPANGLREQLDIDAPLM